MATYALAEAVAGERSRGNKGTDAARECHFEVAAADQNAARLSILHRVAFEEAREIAERSLDQLRPPGILASPVAA